MTAAAPRRPVLRYHGGKWRTAPWIIGHFPEHRTYVEPFGGAASVLMRKPRAEFEVYNDLDVDVVNVFRVLRDPASANRLADWLRLTPWARAEFEASYERSDDPIEQARRTIVRTFMAHGTTSLRKGRTGFRAGAHPHRRGGGHGDWPTYPDAIAAFVERLRGVVVESRDAFDLLQRYDAIDTLFFVDPPYLHSTRSSMRGPGDSDRCYRHELTDDGHRRLAAMLASRTAAVVVSGYPSALYDLELFVGWERHERKTPGDHATIRTEVIWIKPAGVRMPAPASQVQASLLDVMNVNSDAQPPIAEAAASSAPDGDSRRESPVKICAVTGRNEAIDA